MVGWGQGAGGYAAGFPFELEAGDI